MKTRILFVCLGNICRSPAAEEIFRTQVARQALSDSIEADSAGTYSGHAGNLPDPRMRRAAADCGNPRRGGRAGGVRKNTYLQGLFPQDGCTIFAKRIYG